MQLRDRMSTQCERALMQRCGVGEDVLFCLRSDLSLERQYGESYLVATRRGLFVLDSESVVLELGLADVSEVTVDELFGGGRLVAKLSGERVVLVYYTKALAPQFGVLSRAVNQLIRGQAKKIAALPNGMINRSLSMAFSAEMAGESRKNLLDVPNLQESNGSVGCSPSATAYFALDVEPGDSRAMAYIRDVADGHGLAQGGGIPVGNRLCLYREIPSPER